MAEFIPLAPDEPIGVVALSGPVRIDRLEAGLHALRNWGHEIVCAPNLSVNDGYLAGSDDERLSGLEGLLDRGVRMIIAVRGGYGVTRIVDRLPWSRFVEAGVRCVGFSDVTAYSNALAQMGCAQVHGPMVAAGLAVPANAQRLYELLRWPGVGRPIFSFSPASVVRHGVVRGPAFGFNLSMLTTMIGGGHETDLNGAILFLEEVGERLYRLDRMLTQLRRSGRLRGVKALMCGSLHRCGPASGRRKMWQKMMSESVDEECVIVDGLPFGHGKVNMAFPIGVTVEVDTTAGMVTWI